MNKKSQENNLDNALKDMENELNIRDKYGKGQYEKDEEKKSLILWTIILLIVVGAGIIMIIPPEPPKPLTKEEKLMRLADEKKEKRNHQIRNAEYALEQYIMNTMHNPSSYEKVETRHIDKGDIVSIIIKYRGTNAFGGIVTETMIADINLTSRKLLDIGRL